MRLQTTVRDDDILEYLKRDGEYRLENIATFALTLGQLRRQKRLFTGATKDSSLGFQPHQSCLVKGF